ncbi:uncharacterized protein B0J16DRAFT_369893 [Fusarium flagelliforme]|uniref:uncharacterized protein n=1 Tax=Fusarium flagelliforme TaxID=2675880 RepID=UPI001E8DF507|nr:uncharacterized protein B0J16DRAFT_369893 [Fusarium flagelliforme]KAH7193819.1 hypothetical protein B0J16DRAFT_369893 [Fusarium flagelliforme]
MSGSAKTQFEPPSVVELESLSSSPTLRTTWLSNEFEKSSSSCSSSIKIAFIDAWRDISAFERVDSSRCRRVGWQFLAIIWISFLFTLLGFLPIGTARSNATPCRPDGNFQMDANEMFDEDFYYSINWWAAESFFQVTLSWGKLTFTSAKLIDVVWDLVVGRGGQFIMSLVTWHVFTQYLEVSIASKPATYTTVWLVRFRQDTSVLSMIRLVTQFFRQGLASKAAMSVMAATLSLLLAFPTIAGSMTGYTTFNDPYMTSSSGKLFPFRYEVKRKQNGSPSPRLTHNIGDPSEGNYYPLWRMFDQCFDDKKAYKNECQLQWDVSQYVQQYSFNGSSGNTGETHNKTTTFRGQTIDWPPLNISAYDLPNSFYWGWTEKEAGYYYNDPFRGGPETLYLVDSDLYTSSQLEQNGVCQPTTGEDSGQLYQWGFSFLQLYTVVILLLLWSLALMVLWKQSHETLKLNSRETTSRQWKGLLDLTDTIRCQLKQADIDINNLSDNQLENEIQKILNGGSVSSEYLSAKPFSFWRWLGTKKWWILRVFFITGLLVEEHVLRPVGPRDDEEWLDYFQILLFPPLYAIMSLIVAFTFGNTLKQKVVLFTVACGVCIPFFFYSYVHRDAVLPGVALGLCLALAFGTTQGSRWVLFAVPFTCNWIVVFISFFAGFHLPKAITGTSASFA